MIDVHTHFFPKELFQAIWDYFETHSRGLWFINYKIAGEEYIHTLKGFGVKRFTSLVYPHKMGVAAHLNDFIIESKQKYSEIIPFGTLYSKDENLLQMAEELFLIHNFYGLKMHPFVSKDHIDDPAYFPVYELMESTGKILLCHPGSAPVFSDKTGYQRIERILKQFPELIMIIAHCGAYEYQEYSRIASEYPNVYFDTAMNFVQTPVFVNNGPSLEFINKHKDRLLFGSDFPNIPYDYDEQIKGIQKLPLDPFIKEQIFYKNAQKLFGINLEDH